MLVMLFLVHLTFSKYSLPFVLHAPLLHLISEKLNYLLLLCTPILFQMLNNQHYQRVGHCLNAVFLLSRVLQTKLFRTRKTSEAFLFLFIAPSSTYLE